ncbi:MAG TPA: hypothetical protein VEQ59_17290 [Polyangiaceae bacterium]|nr:hypothetical protein [Polyangiaceae bacterium]
MRRARARQVLRGKRSLVLRFLTAALAIAAIALSLVPASLGAASGYGHSVRSIAGGPHQGTVETAPPRLELPYGNERRSPDDGLLPWSSAASYEQSLSQPHPASLGALAYGARRQPPRKRFCRRIPRMNTEDPPGALAVLHR